MANFQTNPLPGSKSSDLNLPSKLNIKKAIKLNQQINYNQSEAIRSISSNSHGTESPGSLEPDSSRSNDRPKTSRKIPIPSPDEFTDYVVTSPALAHSKSSSPSRSLSSSSEIHIIHGDDENINTEPLKSSGKKGNHIVDWNDMGDSTMKPGSDAEYDEIIRLGCWLFGIGLKGI